MIAYDYTVGSTLHDAHECLGRSTGGCAWTAAGVVPVGKIGSKALRPAAKLPRKTGGVHADEDLINLASDARANHILSGEVRSNGSFGGGHRAGPGFPKKSEFPADWSDEQIMHNVSDVATGPTPWHAGDGPTDFWANGTRDGIDIEVLIRDGQIWTAYPTNVVPNP